MSLKLHQLIHSLNGAEKRYFRLQAQMIETQKPKQYLTVFDVLINMKTYNESIFISNLNHHHVSTKNIHADKNYLYNSILDALSGFYANNSGEMKMLQCLSQIEVLYIKNLTSQALIQLRKAKKIARKYNLFAYHLQLFEWEQKLLGFPDRAKDLDIQATDYELILKSYTTFIEYDFLYKKANLLRKKIVRTDDSRSIEEWKNEIANHPLLQEKNMPDSFHARIRFYQIKTAHYYVMGDVEKEFETNKKIIELMQAQAHFIAEYLEEYVAIFSRFLILTKSVASEKYTDTLTQFQQIPKQFKTSNQAIKAKVFTLYHSSELTRMIYAGMFEEAEAYLPEIKVGFKRYDNYINPTYLLASHYRFAYVYIAVGKPVLALKEVNKIALMDKELRPDLFRFAKLLTLLIHLELGNKSLIPYLKKSTVLYIKKQKKIFKIERLFLRYISKFQQTNSKKTYYELLNKFKTELLLITQNEEEKKALLYFDFIRWADAQLAGVFLKEYLINEF